MTLRAEDFRPHYRDFLIGDRILLTGHSHQAWPDVAREGLLQSYEDAASYVDDKWSRAYETADELRTHIAALLGGGQVLGENIALASNTHDLLVRLLSALPLRKKPKIVTTNGEFHSARRQFDRLREEGVNVVAMDAFPVASLAERLLNEACSQTAAIFVSSVLFATSTRVPELNELAIQCAVRGLPLIVDSYHHVNAAPFAPLDAPAFILGGGYKYLQWGEGVCFLSVPENCALRPVVTGWFAEFGELDVAKEEGARVGFARDGATRFAGSTYDPASHYRAAAVARLFRDQGWTPEVLREISTHQSSKIIAMLRAGGVPEEDILTPLEVERRGGFVAVRVTDASRVVTEMRKEDVFVDSRGEVLRFGPAPYLLDDEIDRGVECFLAKR